MFERLDNFRDFGGHPTPRGQVANGRLFRSAHHAGLTDADLERLHGLGVAVVVDLRHPSERERHPSRRHSGFAGTVIETDIEAPQGDPWLAFLSQTDDLSPAAFEDYIRRFYRGAPFEAGLTDVFGRYFRALAEVDGPVLVHCMAGKDRTGILAGLTHRLLGVADEHLYADYLLSNDPAAAPSRLAGLRSIIAREVGRTVEDEALHAALAARAEYLRLALEAIEETHGSVAGYLEDVLGVDAALRRAIGERLVVPA